MLTQPQSSAGIDNSNAVHSSASAPRPRTVAGNSVERGLATTSLQNRASGLFSACGRAGLRVNGELDGCNDTTWPS